MTPPVPPRTSPPEFLDKRRQDAARAARKGLQQVSDLPGRVRGAAPLRFDSRGFPIPERVSSFEDRVRRWLGRF